MLETVSVSRSHTLKQEQQQQQRKQLAISTLFGTSFHQQERQSPQDRVEIVPNSPYSDNRYPTRLGQLLDTSEPPQFVMPGTTKNNSNNRTPPMQQYEPQRASLDGYNSSPSNSSSSTTPDTSLTEIHQPPGHNSQFGNTANHHYVPLHPHDVSSYNNNRASRILSGGEISTAYSSSNGSRQSSRSTIIHGQPPPLPQPPRESILGTSPPIQAYIHHHPGGHNLNKRASLQQKKSFEPAFNKHTSLSAAAGAAGPTSGAITPREQKRQSRFGWFSSSRSSSAGSGSLPNISEPVLEFSTSELVLDGRRSMAIGPRQSSLMAAGINPITMMNAMSNGGAEGTTVKSPRFSTEYGNVQRPPRPHTPTRSDIPPMIQESTHERTDSEESQVERFEREIIDRNSRMFSPASVSGGSISERQMSFADRLDREIHENTNKDLVVQKRNSTPAVPISSVSDGMSPEEIIELKRKLKESDDKRRLMIIEYQQKLDSERKKTVDLQKKLDSLNKYVNEKKVQSDTNSAKIKSLESQRDVLRQALVTLKETKDMKINEYRNQLEKTRVTRFSMMPTIAPSASSISLNGSQITNGSTSQSPSPNMKAQTTFEGNLRIGVGPLLPINKVVDMKG
jgi:hypothetical protein